MDLGTMLGIGGLAAAGGLIASTWGTLRGLLTQLTSYAVMTATFDSGYAVSAVQQLLYRKYAPSRFGPRNYYAERVPIRSTGRRTLLAFRRIEGNQVFWIGWLPVLVQMQRQDNGPDMLRVTYLRGTFDPDTFVDEACANLDDRLRHGESNIRRYRIEHIHGTADREIVPTGDGPGVLRNFARGGSSDDDWAGGDLGKMPVSHNLGDIGEAVATTGSPIDRVSLPPDGRELLDDVRLWMQKRDWFLERGVPWRIGLAFKGPPGTGKTSLARAIAQEFDLPVFVMDLATLRNDELVNAWNESLGNSPCMILIEDIDAVYDGRRLVENGPSFDCLLNCIDGIARTDGMMLVITTNHPEKLEEALVRPGRVDRCIAFPDLAWQGRFNICGRILRDWPYAAKTLADRLDGANGSRVEAAAVRVATRLLFLGEAASSEEAIDGVIEAICRPADEAEAGPVNQAQGAN